MSKSLRLALLIFSLLLVFGSISAQEGLLPLPGRSARVITSDSQDRDVVGMPYHDAGSPTEKRIRLIVEFNTGAQVSSFAPEIKFLSVLNERMAVVKASANNIERIRQMPGVKAVYPDVPVSADNATSVPYIGSQNFWNTTGFTGSGIKIAVIDSGIDYRHKTFGAATTFPSEKVVGGYDYVDDDTDPLDCDLAGTEDVNAHGTHVAATAAGFGVKEGATYNGPWNATTDFAAMSVGSGVAPEAKLLAYRVLDCNGSGLTSDVLAAIQQAVTDGASVINLALSTPYGGGAEVYEAAITAATNAGVIVIASAGDSGDAYFATGQPGTSSRAISVGSGNENDNASEFSARGPGTEMILKPDLIAPGEGITSAFGMQQDTGAGISQSGTSMASAHVAGAAVLLRQKYPNWSYDQIKALMMNTALDLQNTQAVRFGPGRVGAGRVSLNNMLNGEVIAYDKTNPALVSVSFGVVEVGGTNAASRQITLRNMTANALTYNVAFDTVVDMTGAVFSVSPATVNLAANGTATVTVTLNTDLSLMVQPNKHDLTVSEGEEETARHWLSEESGYITLSRNSLVRARVPVYAMPRPAAQMTGSSPLFIGNEQTGVAQLPFSGAELLTGGNLPYDVMSQVTLFEHQLTSPSLSTTPVADLQYLGITSDYLTQSSASTSTLYFGLSTYGNWTSPQRSRFVVEIDTNQDGVVDGELYNSSLDGDTFVSVYRTVASNTSIVAGRLNEFSPLSIDTRLFNTNMMVLPVDLTMLGFAVNDLDFQYRVKSYIGGVLVDQVPATGFDSYNIASPIYSFNDLTGSSSGPYPKIPTWGALNDAPIPVDYDLTSVSAVTPDILALHHHNGVNRAELIAVQYVGETDLQITKQVDKPEPNEGEQITFTLQLSNNGGTSAPDVQVSEVLPAGLSYVSSTASAGSYSNGVWDLTGYSLLPATSASLTITAGVNAGTLYDRIINQVSIISTHPATIDTDTSNNNASVQVCVGGFTGCETLPLSPFALSTPTNGAVFGSGSGVTNLVWQASENAISYSLNVSRANPAAQILNLSNLTPEINSDALSCVNGICTFIVSAATQSQLTTGNYQWTVTASNGYEGLVASNAPFGFSISDVVPTSTPIISPTATATSAPTVELLKNSGFEIKDGKNPVNWKVKKLGKDKIKCNKPEEDKFFAYEGNCAFQFIGEAGEGSKLKQSIDLTTVTLDSSDTLTLSVYAQSKSLPQDKLNIIVKFTYTDNSVDSMVLKPTGGTYSYTYLSSPKTLTKTLSAMKALIKFKGTSGKVLLDELSLSFPLQP
jgi:uncharacterized repeat protein (TIGR01451 family)